MKGITPVIATILLLLITISMVGFAFVWFTGIFRSIATSTENATNQQMIQMNQKINIESPKNQSIAIRNIGSYAISNTTLSVYVNGAPKTCSSWSTTSVAPNAIIVANCTCNSGDTIKVTAPGNYDTDTCIG